MKCGNSESVRSVSALKCMIVISTRKCLKELEKKKKYSTVEDNINGSESAWRLGQLRILRVLRSDTLVLLFQNVAVGEVTYFHFKVI